jgi:hypothetical protein
LKYLYSEELVYYWFNTENKALLDFTPVEMLIMGKENTLLRIMRESIVNEPPIQTKPFNWDCEHPGRLTKTEKTFADRIDEFIFLDLYKICKGFKRRKGACRYGEKQCRTQK